MAIKKFPNFGNDLKRGEGGSGTAELFINGVERVERV